MNGLLTSIKLSATNFILGDGVSSTVSMFNKIGDSGKTIFLVLAVIMMVVAGGAFMVGRKAREWAKGHVLWVGVGVVVVVAASTIIGTFINYGGSWG